MNGSKTPTERRNLTVALLIAALGEAARKHADKPTGGDVRAIATGLADAAFPDGELPARAIAPAIGEGYDIGESPEASTALEAAAWIVAGLRSAKSADDRKALGRVLADYVQEVNVSEDGAMIFSILAPFPDNASAFTPALDPRD